MEEKGEHAVKSGVQGEAYWWEGNKITLNDASAMLEIGKLLVSVFVMSQVEEKEAEIAGLKKKLEQLLVRVDEEKSVSARACAERAEIKELELKNWMT
ncbi:hypothetical protein Tco_1025190 [Tanacetum coccineum]